MLRASLFCISICCSAVLAQNEGKLLSGPKAGTDLPAPFESFNLNGSAKGRPHCLVCQFGLKPSVLVFAREPAEGKDAALNDLLAKLDEAMTEFQDRSFSAGIVFLSPDCRDSTTNADEKDAEKIIQEAIKRKELHARLTMRADKVKNVIVACHSAEGPKKYNLNPKAGVTVLFYDRMKIIENFAFGPDEMTGKDVDAMMARIRKQLTPSKK